MTITEPSIATATLTSGALDPAAHRPRPPRTRAADRLVETLRAYGIRWVFGVPGAKIDPVFDALADIAGEPGGPELITCRNEQNAAFMAAAVGRLTGVPGVALVTSGPGTSNLVTGLVTATTEGDPMVAICGSVQRSEHLKRTHQSMDAAGLLSAVTKSACEVTAADNVSEALASALRTAMVEPRGATAVVLPYDVSLADTNVRITRPHSLPPLGPAPAGMVDRAARLLRRAQFPVILAGTRAGADRVVEAMHRLLGRCDLPVVETFQAAGIISHDLEAHYLGRVGFARNQPGDVILDRADAILAVGYDFVEYEPSRWNATGDRTIIHLDEIPADIDNHYRPALELVGDIASTLGALAGPLDGLRLHPGAREVVDTELDRLARTSAGDPGHDDTYGLDPVAVVAALRRAAPDDTIVTCDVGSHYLFMARYFRTYRPRSLLFSNGQQTLGVAMPWAIAATMARPGRPVLSVSGDGGFLFSAAELETAVRLGAQFTHVVFNDGTYDMVGFQQLQKYGRTSGVRLGSYDLVGYAEAFGAHGHRVTRIGDLVPTVTAALAEPGPSIIDVPVDYRDNMRALGGDLLSEVLL